MRVRKGVGSRLEGARGRWAGKAAGEQTAAHRKRQTPSTARANRFGAGGAKGRHFSKWCGFSAGEGDLEIIVRERRAAAAGWQVPAEPTMPRLNSQVLGF